MLSHRNYELVVNTLNVHVGRTEETPERLSVIVAACEAAEGNKVLCPTETCIFSVCSFFESSRDTPAALKCRAFTLQGYRLYSAKILEINTNRADGGGSFISLLSPKMINDSPTICSRQKGSAGTMGLLMLLWGELK